MIWCLDSIVERSKHGTYNVYLTIIHGNCTNVLVLSIPYMCYVMPLKVPSQILLCPP
jgi:hypothetical protein